ncbi:MAG: ATP-dependent 6-phosphofructokinase [Gemmatimonadetes bacterium]|uniref:ATP-dependent 6-phosphofructokinase n=1 Tax=Candidatus Kutchimonas denitrificans TaxID=3056748 RepID=A0AAE5C8X1_9BACT|nr:ATP-dependent 6-phosphofructokinase [Gemmatimonadota bacterium]NIR74881.1 ATP-dependent 6-phosphofructokinase [Candidatus Kutchimonas denitrificans]NIR99992.1 ATP-dependent 6-phosphofructokinase [Gemmatimonadota bacterium]NIT65576.1 ATP-dependent 6-phosphofructokinase [Gemmatimonadota bacterium]NIU52546.1 ATP-dependent 6-phosphofructokinase [Gemmatimonadota bacterium]
MKKIAINTGGGDAQGLNAVIRAATLSAINRGWEVYGIRRAYQGLLEEGGIMPLTQDTVRGITHVGGTILGTTNRGNPFAMPVTLPDGTTKTVDRSADVITAFEEHGFDALIAIGGDGSLTIARDLAKQGLPVVGVPKTIDNDIEGTTLTFGFLTAVDIATDAIDRLHSTAQAHERVMVVEVMGRHAGWIALFAGVAGTADVILIPEIPYRVDKVCQKVMEREERGRRFAIIVVAEGAYPVGGEPSFTDPEAQRLGGVGEVLARQIGGATGKETRALALRHLQRGGSPNSYDRLIALRFGAAAVRCVEQGEFGCMIALDPPDVASIPLEEAVARQKLVPIDGDVVATARDLGVSFGD